MHINSGKFKGFPIITKDISGTRPTSDKVKQAMFNVLGPAIEGNAALDLFAGFGSLGLEALSRGAVSAVFVESKVACARVIEANIERTGVEAVARGLCMDAFKAMGQLEKEGAVFQIALSDAPYGKDMNAKVLNALGDSAILEGGGLLFIQHEKGAGPPAAAQRWQLLKSYTYGDTAVTLFQKVI